MRALGSLKGFRRRSSKDSSQDSLKTGSFSLKTAKTSAVLLFLSFTATVWAEKTQPDPDLVLREQMVVMSRQLGVTCTHCHDPNNYKSDKIPAFKVAKDHIRIVSWLNSQDGFAGKPKVDCYLCHRGELQPAFREPVTTTKPASH